MRPIDVVVIDPPWPERGGGKRGADTHYGVVPVRDMPALVRSSPLWTAVEFAPDGLCWCWTTETHREVAVGLMAALGYRKCAAFVWVKPSIGLGQWTRMRHEHLLLGRRGHVRVPPPSLRCPSVIEAPVPGRVHSAKPPEAWTVIENTSTAALGRSFRGAEFFSRAKRPGWSAWGTLDGPGTAAYAMEEV